MSNKVEIWVVVIECDNSEPRVYGPYSTSQEAEKKLLRIKEAWDEWSYEHSTGQSVVRVKK